ncbi:serine protease 1 [Eurosta solidaginis]|uniref:serine protease 1 n=1 Tax=Eurosta solidaginis TaxID=178769 RepID=UPI00353105E1
MLHKKLFVFITFFLLQFNKFVLNLHDVKNSTQGSLVNEVRKDDSNEYTFLITSGYRPEHPSLTKHVVSLRAGRHRHYFGDNHFCAGTIMTPRIIITAAHCLCKIDSRERWSPNVITVVAGTPKRLIATDKTQILKVHKIIRHTYYNPKSLRNDIGILILSSSIKEDNETAQRIDVAYKKPEPNTPCTVLGWGRIMSDGPMPNEALYVNITILDEKKCGIYKNLAHGMLCAGDPRDFTKDACQADSGGPMFCNNVLTGVVSFGIGCGDPRAPGVYTDVSAYIKWIEQNYSNKLSPDITFIQAVLLVILLNYF